MRIPIEDGTTLSAAVVNGTGFLEWLGLDHLRRGHQPVGYEALDVSGRVLKRVTLPASWFVPDSPQAGG